MGRRKSQDDTLERKNNIRDDHRGKWNKEWKYEVALSRLDFEILIAIAMGCNTNKELHKKLRKRKGKNVPKSTISRYTSKLKKLGLITQKKIYNLRPFELTEKAKVAISIASKSARIQLLCF